MGHLYAKNQRTVACRDYMVMEALGGRRLANGKWRLAKYDAISQLLCQAAAATITAQPIAVAIAVAVAVVVATATTIRTPDAIRYAASIVRPVPARFVCPN